MSTDTATDEKLCTICEKHPQMGRAARYKQTKICVECSLDLMDQGTCPMCRDVEVLNNDPEHMSNCNGKLPKQERAKSSSGKSKKELDMEEERKVQEAQERLDKRRAQRDGPVKNVRDMTLEELQDRINGKWIDIGRATSTKTERIHVKHITALDGDETTLTTDNGTVRVIDRTKIQKLQKQR